MYYSFSEISGAVLCLIMVGYLYRSFAAGGVPEPATKVDGKEPRYDQNDDLATIATFNLAFDAERAKALLEAHAIQAFVMDANTIGLNQALTWAAGGVRLQVRLRQASLAHNILRESGFEALSDIRHHHHCPKCQSTNIDCHGLSRWQMILSVLVFGALLLFLKRDYSCSDCRHEWSS